MKAQRIALVASGLIVAGAGGVAAVTASALALPGLVFSAAALISVGGFLSPAVGCLGLVLALSDVGLLRPDTMSIVGAVFSALFLGFLFRQIDGSVTWVKGAGASGTAAFLCLMTCVLLLLPPDLVRLFTVDGEPMLVELTLQEGSSMQRVSSLVPVVVPFEMWSLADALVACVSFVAGFIILLGAQVGGARLIRLGAGLGLFSGMALFVFAVVVFVQMASGATMPIDSPDLLSAEWSRRVHDAAIITMNTPSEGALALGSRQALEPLRAFVGAGLFFVSMGLWRRGERAPSVLPTTSFYLPLALACGVVSVPFLGAASMLVSIGALLIGLGSLILHVGGQERSAWSMLLVSVSLAILSQVGFSAGWLPP